jgi:hypothetical protein
VQLPAEHFRFAVSHVGFLRVIKFMDHRAF